MPSPFYCQPLIDYMEQQAFPCRVECSYKLTPTHLEQDRFVFEIEPEDIDAVALTHLAKQFNAPQAYIEAFTDHHKEANAILIGAAPDKRGTIYKIYFEFWEKIKTSLSALNQTSGNTVKSLPNMAPQTLHLGFKWYADDSRPCVIDNYLCHPLLNMRQIMHKVSDNLTSKRSNGFTQFRQAVIDLIDQAGKGLNRDSLIYTEIEAQSANDRSSFIVNLNKANLHLNSVRSHLEKIHSTLSNEPNHLNHLHQLMSDHCDAWLGNIAGGLDRDGAPFFTAYYMYR